MPTGEGIIREPLGYDGDYDHATLINETRVETVLVEQERKLRDQLEKIKIARDSIQKK